MSELDLFPKDAMFGTWNKYVFNRFELWEKEILSRKYSGGKQILTTIWCFQSELIPSPQRKK